MAVTLFLFPRHVGTEFYGMHWARSAPACWAGGISPSPPAEPGAAGAGALGPGTDVPGEASPPLALPRPCPQFGWPWAALPSETGKPWWLCAFEQSERRKWECLGSVTSCPGSAGAEPSHPELSISSLSLPAVIPENPALTECNSLPKSEKNSLFWFLHNFKKQNPYYAPCSEIHCTAGALRRSCLAPRSEVAVVAAPVESHV